MDPALKQKLQQSWLEHSAPLRLRRKGDLYKDRNGIQYVGKDDFADNPAIQAIFQDGFDGFCDMFFRTTYANGEGKRTIEHEKTLHCGNIYNRLVQEAGLSKDDALRITGTIIRHSIDTYREVTHCNHWVPGDLPFYNAHSTPPAPPSR